jgi:PKD repeat protein
VAPVTVNFTNYSTGNLTSRSWDFGDGGNSIVDSPSHTYTTAGSYPVTLTVTSAGGSDTETKLGYIVVSAPPPVAQFSGTPLTGSPGMTANFTDASTGVVSSWAWDFGDGSTSTTQNPSHSFANPGAYSITLTVTGSGGIDSERKVGYVVVGQPPPVADFVADVTTGLRPLTVNFTDQTGGPTTSWSWTFGDGNTSTLQNPSNTYISAGTYTVTLTSTGPGGSDSETKIGYIVAVEQPPIAEFSGSPTSGVRPLAVSFTDASTGGPVSSRLWDFGDGTTSTATNPAKTYTVAGVYTVSLTTTGAGGTDTETKASYISVAEQAPIANFTGTPLSGVAPLTVVFTNTTTGGPVTTYTWSFGDTTTSNQTNPTKVYSTPGTYTVILSATGPGGTDNEVKTGYITVNAAPPVAEFSASDTEGTTPLSVDFTDLSSGAPTSWSWSFGDGGTSAVQNPSYVYSTPGLYTVSLTVIGPSGADTETKTGYIDVKPVVAEFIGSPTSGGAPLLVSFTDLSLGTISSWAWNFGDGATSTAQNVAHTYTTFGNFTVTLTVTGPSGSDTETKVGYIEVGKDTKAQTDPPLNGGDAEPAAGFWGRPLIGPAPLAVDFHDASIGNWGSRTWTFGDGGTGNGLNPVHTYTVPGTYTVSMTATRNFGAIIDTETKVGYIVVTLPIVFEDPSFEDDSSWPLPSAAWSMSGTGALVLSQADDQDPAMPTHGEKWLALGTEGTSNARPASNPLGEGDLPLGAAGVAQTFAFDSERPMLAFEAAFLLGEQPNSAANDFFSIDVSDGVRNVNLYHADTFSKLARARRADGRFRTEVTEARWNLAELFPEAGAGTELTLWIQVGNGGDDRNPSTGYVDNFRVGPVAKVASLGLSHPQCFSAPAPVSGRRWLSEVDASAVTGAQFTVVVGHERADANVLATSGSLLDLSSSQAFFSLLPASGGIDVHEVRIPSDPALIGKKLYAQGVVIGPTGRHYCNALELLLGF